MIETLAPCPFCGTNKSASVTAEPYQTGHYVECMECPKVRGPLRASRVAAINAWNQRNDAIPPDVRATIIDCLGNVRDGLLREHAKDDGYGALAIDAASSWIDAQGGTP